MHAYEKATIKVIALLLGFYVSTMMSRWWGQIVKLPHLSDLGMELNGLTVPGKLFKRESTNYSRVQKSIENWSVWGKMAMMMSRPCPSSSRLLKTFFKSHNFFIMEK